MDEVGATQGGRTIFRRKLSPVDLERMNLPEEFWRTKIFNVAESVRTKVERFLVNVDLHIESGLGMIVSGSSGVGKTGIASLVLKEARSRGYPVFFTTVWDLREAIRSRVPFDDETSMQERCFEVDVLVLDGLRGEDAKEQILGARALEEMVLSRSSRKKSTIVTTRLGQSELFEKYPSFMEAVKGSLAFLHVEGPDMRELQSKGIEERAFGAGTGTG